MTTKKDFLSPFTQFYKRYFESSAEAVEMLAKIQTDFPREYSEIREFSSDPNAIKELVNKLSIEKQGVLLKLLLQAGNFGLRMANLFESDPKEKLKFAKDLKNFAVELSEIMGESRR